MCSDGLLANNLWDVISLPSAGEAYGVSTTRAYSGPVARNTWVVAKSKFDDGIYPSVSISHSPSKNLLSFFFFFQGEDDILHYGQKFVLHCEPGLRVDPRTGMCMAPLYLRSQTASTSSYSKISRYQEVCD